MQPKPFVAACENNKFAIAAVLADVLEHARDVLEIGSGTGQHAVYFAAQMPHLTWHTSDLQPQHAGIRAWIADAGLANVRDPVELDVARRPWPVDHIDRIDAVYAANTAHMMTDDEVGMLVAGTAAVVANGGVFVLYGPFNENGRFTSEGNRQLDRSIRRFAPAAGLKDIAILERLAHGHGFVAVDNIAMPANNRLLVWRAVA